jgi:hypothetical protein
MVVLERQMSMRTIYRRIRSHGLASYRPNVRLPLTPEHRVARLEWCRLREHWVDEWHQIIFSVESRFCLWQLDRQLRVRRRRGQRLNLQFALRRHSGLTPGVMVWKPVTFSLHSRKSECGPVHQRSFGASFAAIPSKASQQCFSAIQCYATHYKSNTKSF